MSLRILFADDSVTAQNMGKKILTEAGYDVVAVSNGAAAVKKIAEQKPDIIILDVYMPGYTGLEVCEKVRGSIETLKTPVLLTVGKLEPYKPEEANRVRADGVIVKPFEASDLLAIVKKFEERLSQAGAPPLVQRSMAADSLETADAREYPEHTMAPRIPQVTVEVPDHMATASAFSDLLGSEASHGLGPFNANASGADREVAPRSEAYSAPIPDYELPVSWRKDVDVITTSPAAPPTNRSTAQETRTIPPPPTPLRPRQIPVYQDGEPSAVPDVVPTAAAPTGDVIIPREPYLQESDAEATRNTVADTREPGLVPTTEESSMPVIQANAPAPLESTGTRPHEAGPRLVETAAADPAPGPRLVARGGDTPGSDPVETKISESDFEARVAAALQAYNQAAAARDNAGTAGENATHEPAAASPRNQLWPEPSAGSKNIEPPASRAAQLSPASGKPSIPTQAQSTRPGSETFSSPAELDGSAAQPAKSLAAQVQEATGSDHNTIAQAVHRVIERLKPELVDEIVKELKSKK